MKVFDTPLDGLKVVEPRVFSDERGFFCETWNAADFAAAGLDAHFVQDNHSRSARGVLRGLHFQNPGSQGKLIRVTAGAVWDVAVDLRRSSSRFGCWWGIELSAANARMLWMPEGFAHGFLTLADGTDMLYKCTAPYCAAQEHAVRWDDRTLAIPWPLDGATPLLSVKDATAPPFTAAPTFV